MPRPLRWLLPALIATVIPGVLAAQPAPPADVGPPHDARQSLWGSFGVGGTENPEAAAALASLWYAHGPLVAGARASVAASLSPDVVLQDRALLAGARVRSSGRLLLLLAGGVSRASTRCYCSGEQAPIYITWRRTAPTAHAELAATGRRVGIGLDFFTVFGGAHAAFSGATVSLQLGRLR